jgi:hypothetical protein
MGHQTCVCLNIDKTANSCANTNIKLGTYIFSVLMSSVEIFVILRPLLVLARCLYIYIYLIIAHLFKSLFSR